MQVKVYDKIKECYKWENVTTSEGRLYEYPTEEEALKMLKICYPEETRFKNFEKARVIKQK